MYPRVPQVKDVQLLRLSEKHGTDYGVDFPSERDMEDALIATDAVSQQPVWRVGGSTGLGGGQVRGHVLIGQCKARPTPWHMITVCEYCPPNISLLVFYSIQF